MKISLTAFVTIKKKKDGALGGNFKCLQQKMW